MDSSSHGPGGENAKVLKRAATVPGTATIPEKFESVPEKFEPVPAKFVSVPEKFGRVPEKFGSVPEKSGSVPEKSGSVPEKFGSVPERVASAPAVLSHIEKDAGQGKSQQQQQQQQKSALKKPDKLAPCPRCESLDTKFCYYNNYNVNQPRHFCKNCQRYWTAGGTLRNVPVGAGRRKNKHGSLQARHGSLSEQQVRLEPSLRPQRQFSPPLAPSSSYPSSHGRGVSSGAATRDNPLQTAEAARPQCIPAEPQASISSDQRGSMLQDANGDPEAEKEDYAEPCTSSAPSHSSSEMDTTAQEVQSTIRVPAATTTTSTTAATPTATTATTTPQPGAAGVVPGLGSIWTAAPAPFGLFNGSWPFGYNVGWSGQPPGAGQPSVGGITTWSPPPNALWPGVCWASTLIPGMPPPGLVMSPGWGVPWAGADAAAAVAAPTAGISSRLPIRPVLNKHPRDRFELEPHWMPKLARLDDPGTIPRSSVWTAVGAEHQLDSPGSNFKAFLPVRKAPASVTTLDANTTRVES